jgi:predicted lipoprotein
MMKKNTVGSLLFLGLVLLLLTSCFKVVKTGEEEKLTGVHAFCAAENIAEIWDSKAKPELLQKAIPLAQLLEDAAGDFQNVSSKGKYSMGTSGELSFVVNGTATVMEVHSEKKAGYLVVELDGCTTSENVKIQIGNLFKGTAVRDSLDLISYDNYKNQVEWAAVSQSINQKILESTISPINLADLQGKKISFVGCFTATDNKEVLVTPVSLSVL